MSTLASRRRRSVDFWPGFVDALSALLMVLVFLLLIFTVGQFVLSDALSGRDKALAQLNQQLQALANSLSMEQTARANSVAQAKELGASLASTQSEREALRLALDGSELALDETRDALSARDEELAKRIADLSALDALKRELESEVASRLAELSESRDKLVVQTELSAKSAAQLELLNRQVAALRSQLSELSAALDLSRAQVKTKDLRIDDLGKRLNLALANKVNELERYRSDFFGRLREALGNRADVQIVGDRFVVPSELLFASSTDELTAQASAQLDQLAATLKAVTAQIPEEIDWVLRIDGHTDKRPIRTARFPSNWELSTARAIAIVKHLAAAGIAPARLAANGFGEHRPLDEADNEREYTVNRRIEIQLTNR
jgi:chemotaxis protein MotB